MKEIEIDVGVSVWPGKLNRKMTFKITMEFNGNKNLKKSEEGVSVYQDINKLVTEICEQKTSIEVGLI